jgi:3-oxoadipate enol-lactonase
MQFAKVGSIGMHHALSGDPEGRPLVFANSLGTDLRVWDPVLPHLPQGLRIVRYDKRGHGLSDDAPGPWCIEDLADDLAGLLDTLGIRAAMVCGLSVGGMIAQSLAVRRPDLVSALILCDTAAKIGTAELWDERIRAVHENGIASMASSILERWFTSRFRTGNPELALWRNMLVRTPADGYVATCAAIRDADLTEATRGLRVPTLALAGDADGSTPPALVRATAALIPAARFHVIPDAGHLPGVEQPEATARLIEDFLMETRDA